MFITKAKLRQQLADAWDDGHSAGVYHGIELTEWAQDAKMGYALLPEPTPVRTNPHRPDHED